MSLLYKTKEGLESNMIVDLIAYALRGPSISWGSITISHNQSLYFRSTIHGEEDIEEDANNNANVR